MGVMKTTLDLPDELVREIKLRAVMQDQTFKDLVAQLLRQGLQADHAIATAPTPSDPGIIIDERGFPTFRSSPDAPASKMTLDEALAMEQHAIDEEDLTRAGIPH